MTLKKLGPSSSTSLFHPISWRIIVVYCRFIVDRLQDPCFESVGWSLWVTLWSISSRNRGYFVHSVGNLGDQWAAEEKDGESAGVQIVGRPHWVATDRFGLCLGIQCRPIEKYCRNSRKTQFSSMKSIFFSPLDRANTQLAVWQAQRRIGISILLQSTKKGSRRCSIASKYGCIG